MKTTTKSKGMARQTSESGEPDSASGNVAIRRQQMISEAAYFRAEQRGFAAGNEISDWLDAEGDVQRMLERDPAA